MIKSDIKSQNITVIEHNGALTEDPKTIASPFNEYFTLMPGNIVTIYMM
jgi:hypothetical protein